jgi:hypothetical protein
MFCLQQRWTATIKQQMTGTFVLCRNISVSIVYVCLAAKITHPGRGDRVGGNHHVYVCGGLPFAADTRDPHSNSSLLVSSLWQITSMKQNESWFTVVAEVIAAINSSSFLTCPQPIQIKVLSTCNTLFQKGSAKVGCKAFPCKEKTDVMRCVKIGLQSFYLPRKQN